jgi:capsular polysaccharide biosynthesis protein
MTRNDRTAADAPKRSAARPGTPGRLTPAARAAAPARGRNLLLPSALVGLLLGLVVAVAGIALIGAQKAQYSATASLLVLPDRSAAADTVASLYDSLSSGQVVESYRAVMGSPGFSNGVIDTVGLSPRQRAGVRPDVHVVPSTALVDVTVTADTPQVAETVADAISARATDQLSRTFSPYRITGVSPAAGTATKSGPGSRTLLGVVVLLALVVAGVGQQAVLFVGNSRQRSRARRLRSTETARPTSAATGATSQAAASSSRTA